MILHLFRNKGEKKVPDPELITYVCVFVSHKYYSLLNYFSGEIEILYDHNQI